jgi:acyl-[acyl-carrier-protein] desaturase
MPGVGIPDFTAHAAAIARAGIYDFAIHHDQILVPVVLNQWKVDQLEGLGVEAEAARRSLLRHVERVGSVGRRQAARREERAAATVSV